jgi:hypothetical protein
MVLLVVFVRCRAFLYYFSKCPASLRLPPPRVWTNSLLFFVSFPPTNLVASLKGDMAEYLSTQMIMSTVFDSFHIVSFNDANADLEFPPSLPNRYDQIIIDRAWAMPDRSTSADYWFAQYDLSVRSLPPVSSFAVSLLTSFFSLLPHLYIQQIEPAFRQCHIDLLVAPGDTDSN